MKISTKLITMLIFTVMSLTTPFSHIGMAANKEIALRDTIVDLFTTRGELALGREADLARFYEAGSEIWRHERSRPAKFQELEQRWETKILSIKSTPNINKVIMKGDTAEVSVYEWTFFDWMLKGKIITSGFGVNHDMTWGIKNGKWIVLDDLYDEGPLTGVTSPNYKPLPRQDNPSNERRPLTVTPLWYIYYPYDRNAAAGYADSYVYHLASGGQNYEQYYNNSYYKNYNPSGGDCANYVSQSMHAGGAPFVNKGIDDSSSWWYDDKGTYPDQTGDDWSSTTWRYVPSHKTFMVNRWGTSTQGSSLQKGDIVYYNWDSNSSWDHVTIVVVSAADNGGVALVNSHNWDYYHVRWNYGGPNTTYYPVHIFDELPVWIN